jgi:hypothetical protein
MGRHGERRKKSYQWKYGFFGLGRSLCCSGRSVEKKRLFVFDLLVNGKNGLGLDNSRARRKIEKLK